MNKNIILLLLWVCVACQSKEIPVPKHTSGDVLTQEVEMGSDYRWQYYFSLQQNKVVGKNLKTEWDLGFETSAEGYHVVLNTAKLMFAYPTEKNIFESVHDTSGFVEHRKWDEASGNLDSTAIGDWRTRTPVYIIDRGYSESGQHQGFIKFQILSYNAQNFQVRFSETNGTGDTTMIIPKDEAYNFSFLSFQTKKVVKIEPPKAEWDLAFTQYTHIFYDEPEPLPYQVTGCLLNRYKTSAYQDTAAFATASLDYLQTKLDYFSTAINTIGHGWKSFSGTNYVVFPEKTYFIRDQQSVFYKLHFIDFHNRQGVKGTPVWEYQQL